MSSQKSKTASHKRSIGILMWLLRPLCVFFFLQIIITLVMYIKTNVYNRSVHNSYEVLTEKVFNRKLYIENRMIGRWTSFSIIEGKILEILDEKLKAENITFEELKNKTGIQNDILHSIFPELLHLLRKHSVTGAFLILDLPAASANASETAYPGLYLRNIDPASYSPENQDILIARGHSSAIKPYKIALDSDWEPYFLISKDKTKRDTGYFYFPLEAAKKYKEAASRDLRYWSPLFYLTHSESRVVTYSIPLINKDKTVYGVIGIDLTESYLKSFLQFEELDQDRSGVYCLALYDKDMGNTFMPIVINGTLRTLHTTQFSDINMQPLSFDGMYKTKGETVLFKKSQYASVQELNLYPRNSIHESRKWVLMGFVPEENILAFPSDLKKLFWWILAASAILFLIGGFLSSKYISNMLKKVVVKLETGDVTKPIHIEKMGITEMDVLISAVENLSTSVFNAASHVSKIIEQIHVPIGVFEHDTVLKTVFCNIIWFKLFNITDYTEDTVLPEGEFYALLDGFKAYIDFQTEEDITYAIPAGQPGEIRWIKFTKTKEEHRILGIAMDITQEREERALFEVQMNYDELTGLYNRNVFDKKIAEVFKQKPEGVCALVIWNIDNLKFINDSFGIAYGDMHIRAFGKKLITLHQDKKCFVCRLLGDEFCSFFYGFSSVEEIRTILDTFWKELQTATVVFPDLTEMKLRVSAGLAWYPYNADNERDLMRYANFAVYDVKHSFKGSLHEFDMAVYKDNHILIHGMEDLNRMIENELIEYAMQPIVSAASGKVYAYEMLMRPMLPEFKNPMDVLRLARAQSKLHLIEELTLFLAMKTYVKKVEAGEISRDTKVFLNTISSQILPEAKFNEFEEKFRPYLSNIVFEITESEPLNADFFSIKRERIRNWNAMIAIDDYGSGYSNTSSLVFLAPNIVKIDMSIVRDIHKDVDKQNILENLVSYAKKREIIVLAEGVEFIEEIETLLHFGVELFQGYFFAKPSFDVQPIPEDKLGVACNIYHTAR